MTVSANGNKNVHCCSIWHQDKHLFAGCLHFFTYFVLAFLKNMFTFAVVLDNKGKLSVILSYKLFIMKRFLLLCFTLAIATAISIAQESEPQLGITSRTNCSNFWRYNFNYETTDIDGETPIVLSAAIFLSTDIHNKEVEAKGLALMNHYTITTNEECPTNTSDFFTLEGFIQGSKYIIIESDGIGFGQTVDRKQSYLKGRAAARYDIDAFIAGRELLEEEGISFGDVVLNLGYSQGGHSGMWVNRLVAEGYRSDELPKIDYCIIGGGPYDMYAHYMKLATDGMTRYPVAIPLILNGIVDDFTVETISYEDVFKPEFIEKLPEWFDTKQYATTEINSLIYETFGGSEDEGIAINNIVTDEFFNPEGEKMSKACEWLKENSLVYDDWVPEKTDSILFVHSHLDEVVPYVNMENMQQFLIDHNYTNFFVEDNSDENHTDTGMYYAFYVMLKLASYIPTGVEDIKDDPIDNEIAKPIDVYSIDGRLIMRQVSPFDAYERLGRGIYIIGNQKVIKR